MEQTSANWIFQVVSRRYESGTIVLTSSHGFSDWWAVFADRVVAAAILDRLLHHATVNNVKGKSYGMRRHEAQIDRKKEKLCSDHSAVFVIIVVQFCDRNRPHAGRRAIVLVDDLNIVNL